MTDINATTTHDFQQKCGLDPWSKQDLEAAFTVQGTHLWKSNHSFLFFRQLFDEIEIFSIGTLPEHRKKGEASTLIKRLKSYAMEHKITKIFLEVSSTNQKAVSFYLRHDFTQIGERKNYYGQRSAYPGDALILCWPHA